MLGTGKVRIIVSPRIAEKDTPKPR